MTNRNTILSENEALVTDQDKVCEIFNNFSVNVAKNIGSNDISVDQNHPSVQQINHIMTTKDSKLDPLSFQEVDDSFVRKQISSISVKKATGVDDISPLLLKYAMPVVTTPLTKLINKSISSSLFPDTLKQAKVCHIHKKNSLLEKGNYRPVSVLPIISKLFERAIHLQLDGYFNHIFQPFLAAFRSGFGCQSTLLRILEDWKKALDENKYVGAILMDLSKLSTVSLTTYFLSK